jgi:hypothetical protein
MANKLWTIEWDKPYPQFELKANYAVVRSLEDAFKVSVRLGETMHKVTPEEFTKEEGGPSDGMLPQWWNQDNTVRITEYTEESAGPVRWQMLQSWLSAYNMTM